MIAEGRRYERAVAVLSPCSPPQSRHIENITPDTAADARRSNSNGHSFSPAALSRLEQFTPSYLFTLHLFKPHLGRKSNGI